MTKVQFTPEQQLVIDKRKSNILVSAAAGSGKTEVLTKRIVSLITDPENPIDIDRMLILTFTKAAAAEMRERISREISNRLIEEPENENLWRQSTLLLGAQISTIDSFCLFVIRNNFTDINLDPGFRIMDEGEGKLLLKDAIHGIFERHYDDETDMDFRHLIECYSKTGNDDLLENQIIDMYRFVMSNPDPDEWMRQAISAFELSKDRDITDTKLWQETSQVRNMYIEQGLQYTKTAIEMCLREDGPATYLPTIQAYQQCFESLKESKSYERSYKLVNNTDIPALSKAKSKGELPENREYVKSLKEKASGCIDKLKKIYVSDKETIISDSTYVLDAAKMFMQLLRELIQEFSDIKREKNIVDFTDMEHFALDILLTRDEHGNMVPSKSALEYRDFFKVVMVDEYQDSNLVQEYILKSITQDDNYFMVGDVKQSIYRFRQAKPEIFIDKYTTFTSSDDSLESIDTRIDLNKNFRSRQEVVDFVNLVFRNIMHESTSSIDYDEKAMLVRGASYPEGQDFDSQILLLNSDAEELLLFQDDSHVGEALMVADKINQLMQQHYQVTDKETRQLRDITYRDIVILLRSAEGWTDVFTKVLEQQGIPAYSTVKSGYFSTMEIKTILNYLSVIDNPRQDIPFYGVLTSFFGGFSPSEVAAIKAASNMNKEEDDVSLTLYDAFLEYDGEEALERKEKLLKALDTYRKYSSYMSIRDLIEAIIHDTGYLNYMTAFSGGDKRKANILTLLEKASAFEQTSFHGLFHFIRYISMLKANAVDFGEAGVVDENDNVVRIMTIHASKGLEFPVCFVSGCGKQINKSDARNSVLYDMNYGIALDYINPLTREKRHTIQKRLLAQKIELLGLAEEIRVLYVALTRAKEKLFITAEVGKLDKYLSELPGAGELSDADICGASSYIDMILMALSEEGRLNDYLSIVTKTELSVSQVEKGLTKKQLYGALTLTEYSSDEEFLDECRKRMNPVYSHGELKGLYSKTTVSELKKAAYEAGDHDAKSMFRHQDNDEYVPAFVRDMAEKQLVTGGSLRGTAYHRVMELTDFAGLLNANDKKSFAASTKTMNVENGRLTKEAADMVSDDDCRIFYETALANRMAIADSKGQLYREKSFFYGISADRVEPEFPSNQLILVQGVIDVYFKEDDYLVVVDYKTDNVKNEDELVVRYKKQLDIYAEALSNITGLKVEAKIIYSFCLNKEILL